MNRLLSLLSSVSFLSDVLLCLHLVVSRLSGLSLQILNSTIPQLLLNKLCLLFFFVQMVIAAFQSFLLIFQFCSAFISVWLWSLKWLATKGYVLCRLFKITSSFVLFRFLHSLAIMHIILTVENVIKLKWNIYTVLFAENFGLGKWMCVSDILQHMRMWFIDFWWLCWHQCIYLKKSRSLYKCKWERAFHLFPRWK